MNSLKNPKKFWSVLLLLSALVLLNHCGTQTGSGLVAVEFKSYNSSLIRLLNPPRATDIKLCFKRIRFKTEGESTSSNSENDPDNIDFEIGEVTLTNSGTTLGNVNLASGTYKRVEFDLHKDCASGKSVSFTNSSNTYNTEDKITVKFEGTFNLSAANQTLSLGLQNIIDALNGVTNSNAIKDAIENVSGDF